MGGAVGARADCTSHVGGGVGVAGSGGWARPGTAVGAGGRHVAQARIPPWPLAGSFVNPALYLSFSASGSTLQRWPGAWQGTRGEGEGRGAQERGQGVGQGQGGANRARDRGKVGGSGGAI